MGKRKGGVPGMPQEDTVSSGERLKVPNKNEKWTLGRSLETYVRAELRVVSSSGPLEPIKLYVAH